MERTKVIFRMWDGAVIAIFPEIPSSVTMWYECESYVRIGQHSGCDPYMIIAQSTPALPEEYRELYNELTTIGYTLDVKQRMTANMDRVREQTWRDYIKRAQQEGCKVF